MFSSSDTICAAQMKEHVHERFSKAAIADMERVSRADEVCSSEINPCPWQDNPGKPQPCPWKPQQKPIDSEALTKKVKKIFPWTCLFGTKAV